MAPPQKAEHGSFATLREMLTEICVKAVRYGRHITFQLAEVAVARALFADILAPLSGCGQHLWRRDSALFDLDQCTPERAWPS